MRNLLLLLIAASLVSGNLLNAQDKKLKTKKWKVKSFVIEEYVPQWAKKVVWYQIFPERFRNGDPDNDPTLESIKGAFPNDSTSPWQIHPWTSDWYELQPYEKENGKDIWYNIQRRRYGGDLQGILDKLDYLQDLGITALYLNPVFEAPSAHKYDASTFHHIDPHFGPDPEGDKELVKSEIPDDPSTWVWTSADKLFLKLIDEVHKRGMRIIIDGVFNHTGTEFWAFKDVVKNQQNSKYKDWYKITSWDDEEKGTRFEYQGWFGVKELPEFNQDENGIADGPKQYIFDITKRWMDPNGDDDPSDGIDGWRLDVAYMIPHSFWKEWHRVVKKINPDAYLTAEVIGDIQSIKPYTRKDEFDAVMNYNFLFLTAEYFIDDSTAISTTEFDDKLLMLRSSFPIGVSYVMQNLFDSHDTQRLASHIVNRDKYKIRNWNEAFQLTKAINPDYDTRKPNEEEINRMKLMLIFQMTYVGAPYVYYGDEAGMWGANDPDCRKPMVWDDLQYDPEVYLPDQTKRAVPDTVEFNKELFEFYKKLIHIRNKYEALQLGTFKVRTLSDKEGVYVYERVYKNTKIIVALNKGKKKHLISLYTPYKGFFKNLLNPKQKMRSAGGKLVFSLRPGEGKIIFKDFSDQQ